MAAREERNQDATVYVGQLDDQVSVCALLRQSCDSHAVYVRVRACVRVCVFVQVAAWQLDRFTHSLTHLTHSSSVKGCAHAMLLVPLHLRPRDDLPGSLPGPTESMGTRWMEGEVCVGGGGSGERWQW
jgi:hypothetical protein